MKKYIAECRYEWLSANGKVWTDWFPMSSCSFDEDETKETMKKLKQMTIDMDRKTKLRHEYRAMLYSDFEKWIEKIHEDAKAAIEDFKTIKKIARPWANESRKKIKKLREMSNAEKVEWKAKQNSSMI